ncbi:MAG: CotH kinase family protein, partial [Nitrososphaeraceae archaeon]
FAQNVGVRINGNASRNNAMKSLRLIAGSEYDIEEYFNYELFPGLMKSGSNNPLIQFKSFVLSNSGNDWEHSMFRDALMQSLVESSNKVETQAYRPVIVFINGVYWGIHNMRERYDEYYIANHYDLPLDSITILENNAVIKRGNISDQELYLGMRDFAQEHDMSNPDNYNKILTQMDVESYIVQYISNIYFNNFDWPHNNISFWRTNIFDTPYKANSYAKWHWMMEDADFGFGLKENLKVRDGNGDYVEEFIQKYGSLEGAKANTLEWALYPVNLRLIEEWPNVLIRALLKNDEFKFLFINTMADYLNSYFHPDRVLSQINNMQNTLSPLMKEHIDRWGKPESFKVWEDNVEIMRNFAKDRSFYLRNQIVEHFNLSGTAKISLKTDLSKGTILINSIDISQYLVGIDNINNWTGIYFKGVPLKITAIPNAGYIFYGWEEVETNKESLTIVPTEDINLSAIFTKK